MSRPAVIVSTIRSRRRCLSSGCSSWFLFINVHCLWLSPPSILLKPRLIHKPLFGSVLSQSVSHSCLAPFPSLFKYFLECRMNNLLCQGVGSLARELQTFNDRGLWHRPKHPLCLRPLTIDQAIREQIAPPIAFNVMFLTH